MAILCFFFNRFRPCMDGLQREQTCLPKTHTIPINRSPYKLLFRRLRSHADADMSSLVRDPGVRDNLFAVNVLIT